VKKTAIVLAIVCLVGLFFAFDLGRFLQHQELKHPIAAGAMYLAVTALSLPGATWSNSIAGS